MGNYKKKKLTPAQRRQNIRISLLMLAGAVIVLILGIVLIRSLTAAKEPAGEESSASRQNSSVMETISIPQIISLDSLPPEDSIAPADSSKDVSIPESSREDSSQKESSQEESQPANSSEDESSIGESSQDSGQWRNVTDDYFRDAAFIGNSLTEGLFFYTDIGELADGFYSTGLNVSSAQDEAFIDGGYTLEQKLSMKTYGKIYIMMGLNEVGWPDPDVFIEYYESLINQIRRACPGAVIYVQSDPSSQRRAFRRGRRYYQ